METIPTIHDITLSRPSSTYTNMLVLPNMDPGLHDASRSTYLPRAFVRSFMSATRRLSVLLLKITGTAVAMLLLPRTIQIGVQCLDDVYEAMGRRARSPWETQVLWGKGVMAGLAIMFVLHDLLRRISQNVILDEDVEDEQAEQIGTRNRTWRGWEITWERVLMQVIVPLLLYMGLYLMIARVSGWRTQDRDLVKANTVDLGDDTNARLIWRDR
ncbi:hypothetical protein SVAN01_09918 [Stagonosporopsis vannaccii]|nr:hypothetical protein SVAN01_09918 [Stagonosporopsis vannaccii]